MDYDFLKYIRIVFRWAQENYPDLSRSDIEFLLYLYGMGAFTKKDFNDYHKTIGMYSLKLLDRYQKDGYVVMWRPKKGSVHALYVLSNKAKIMCNKMHKFACGVDEIPLSSETNNMGKKDNPRINRYFLDIIKKMNEDRAPKSE